MPEVVHDGGGYDAYLLRFTAELGDVKVGGFAKLRGQLIRKLDAGELAAAELEHTEMLERYRESVEAGDTINDALVKLLRVQAATLVLPAPV